MFQLLTAILIYFTSILVFNSFDSSFGTITCHIIFTYAVSIPAALAMSGNWKERLQLPSLVSTAWKVLALSSFTNFHSPLMVSEPLVTLLLKSFIFSLGIAAGTSYACCNAWELEFLQNLRQGEIYKICCCKLPRWKSD